MDDDIFAPLRLAGRCVSGAERGKGVRYHAVPHESHKALCGAKPGRHSAGWSCTAGETVTCPRCLASMLRIAENVAEIERLP